jgi:hypothetical protein
MTVLKRGTTYNEEPFHLRVCLFTLSLETHSPESFYRGPVQFMNNKHKHRTQRRQKERKRCAQWQGLRNALCTGYGLNTADEFVEIVGLHCTHTSHNICTFWNYSRFEVLTGGDIRECRLLGYKDPVRTSEETHYVWATEYSRLKLCKI